MEFEQKYIKYKTKYLKLLEQNKLFGENTENIENIENGFARENTENDILEGGGQKSSRFKCLPEKSHYNQICQPESNGQYKSKQNCFNDCDKDFIRVQLKKANIYKESLQFYFLTKDLINQEHMKIYIKGGNVIGLAVLKLIYNAYSNDEAEFLKAFNNFLKLELIKDWDFTAYASNKEIDEKYREKLDKIASRYKLVPRAKTFILYQAKYPILTYDKALFEIAVLDSDSTEYSKMEIPLTTMKVRVNEYNLKYIFMMAKSFYTWSEKKEPIDLDMLKKILSQIDIIIHPHKSGLYDPKNKIDSGELNDKLFSFIKKFTSDNQYWTQFLVTQLEDPYRLIYRMPEKNIKKTEKIIEYLDTNIKINKPSWLLDIHKTKQILDKFSKELSNELVKIYQKSNSLDEVLEFLDGVNFGKPQIQIEWEQFDPDTHTRLKNIFEPVVKKMGLAKFTEKVKSFGFDSSTKSSNLSNSGKIIKLFNFLLDKNVFN